MVYSGNYAQRFILQIVENVLFPSLLLFALIYSKLPDTGLHTFLDEI